MTELELVSYARLAGFVGKFSEDNVGTVQVVTLSMLAKLSDMIKEHEGYVDET